MPSRLWVLPVHQPLPRACFFIKDDYYDFNLSPGLPTPHPGEVGPACFLPKERFTSVPFLVPNLFHKLFAGLGQPGGGEGAALSGPSFALLWALPIRPSLGGATRMLD